MPAPRPAAPARARTPGYSPRPPLPSPTSPPLCVPALCLPTFATLAYLSSRKDVKTIYLITVYRFTYFSIMLPHLWHIGVLVLQSLWTAGRMEQAHSSIAGGATSTHTHWCANPYLLAFAAERLAPACRMPAACRTQHDPWVMPSTSPAWSPTRCTPPSSHLQMVPDPWVDTPGRIVFYPCSSTHPSAGCIPPTLLHSLNHRSSAPPAAAPLPMGPFPFPSPYLCSPFRRNKRAVLCIRPPSNTLHFSQFPPVARP